MSNGPIQRWRDSLKPEKVSTPDASRVCAQNPERTRAYCGRKNDRISTVWTGVTCSDCLAARRADLRAAKGR